MTKAGPSDLIGLNEAPVDGNYLKHKNVSNLNYKNNSNAFFQQIQLHIKIFRLSLLDNQKLEKMSIKKYKELDSEPPLSPHAITNTVGGVITVVVEILHTLTIIYG